LQPVDLLLNSFKCFHAAIVRLAAGPDRARGQEQKLRLAIISERRLAGVRGVSPPLHLHNLS
jgi:hypothetical protein